MFAWWIRRSCWHLHLGSCRLLLRKLQLMRISASSVSWSHFADSRALQAFLNKVDQMVKTGKLTAAQGAALTALAQRIIASI